MRFEEIYSPSNLIGQAIEAVKRDPFFITVVGAIQIMLTTAHWICIAIAISTYQTFLPEVINRGYPNLLVEMALVFGIVLFSSLFLLFVYLFDKSIFC